MPDDLAAMAAFAEARLAEDERDAQERDWAAIAMDPAAAKARALREVEAKRAILAAHPAEEYGAIWCAVCDGTEGKEPWPCPTVRHLLAVYSDHPDYLPGWAPAAVGG